jgi:hypothetical protein
VAQRLAEQRELANPHARNPSGGTTDNAEEFEKLLTWVTFIDPISGSRSTLVAAELSWRRYYGIELETSYLELTRRRLAGVERAKSRSAAGR